VSEIRNVEAAVRWSREWFEAWEEFHMEPTLARES
jgi:hypothetical protein